MANSYRILILTFFVAGLAFKASSQTVLNQFPFLAKSIQLNHSTSDGEGNLVVCGYFYGNSADLNGYVLNALKPINSIKEHRVTAFVAKMKMNGTVLWALPFHGNRHFSGFMSQLDTFSMNPQYKGNDNYSHTIAQYVSINQIGDIYVGGNTGADTLTVGTIPMGIRPGSGPIDGYWDNMNIFVTRISGAGNPIWTTIFKGENLRIKEMVVKQDRINCFIQGVIQEVKPSNGFVFQTDLGARMVSLGSSGNVLAETQTVNFASWQILRTRTFPSFHPPLNLNFYIPFTRSNPNSLPTNSMATFQKFNANGGLLGQEMSTGFAPASAGAIGLATTSNGGYYVSHVTSLFGGSSQEDTTTIFQNVVTLPNANSANFLLHKFTSDGCKEWTRTEKGELYNLVIDQDENLYGLIYDTTAFLNQGSYTDLAYTQPYFGDSLYQGTLYLVPKSPAVKLVKYNKKGSKIMDVSLSMFNKHDRMIPWDHMFGDEWYRAGIPASISRIKNDTITITGGKLICHIKDNSQDSVFISNPVSCQSKILFRSMVSVLSNNFEQVDFKLAPNPADDQIDIQLSSVCSQKTNIKISGIQGKIMLTKSIEDGIQFENIKLNAFPPGIYILSLESAGKVVTRKFVHK
jgi:hypothetical protein